MFSRQGEAGKHVFLFVFYKKFFKRTQVILHSIITCRSKLNFCIFQKIKGVNAHGMDTTACEWYFTR
jgi:hypothetical protein